MKNYDSPNHYSWWWMNKWSREEKERNIADNKQKNNKQQGAL